LFHQSIVDSSSPLDAILYSIHLELYSLLIPWRPYSLSSKIICLTEDIWCDKYRGVRS
ncbi:hypothetical protein TNCT_627671, partial [Trichonephila clavata]